MVSAGISVDSFTYKEKYICVHTCTGRCIEMCVPMSYYTYTWFLQEGSNPRLFLSVPRWLASPGPTGPAREELWHSSP